jgi:hypothetical protein
MNQEQFAQDLCVNRAFVRELNRMRKSGLIDTRSPIYHHIIIEIREPQALFLCKKDVWCGKQIEAEAIVL